jgi:metal-dependent amidase/aminoacylase/carboxypeptidase family protein
MNNSNMKPATRTVLDYVRDNATSLTGLCDNLFWFGEPAMQEVRSAELLTEILEDGVLPPYN